MCVGVGCGGREVYVWKQTHLGRFSVTFRWGSEEAASEVFTHEWGRCKTRRFSHRVQAAETHTLTCASKLRVRSRPSV